MFYRRNIGMNLCAYELKQEYFNYTHPNKYGTNILFCDKTWYQCFSSILTRQDRLYFINLLHFVLERLY